MFKLKTISHEAGQLAIMIDKETNLPLMYPMLYCSNKLHRQRTATQQSNLRSIKLFYQFWFKKHGATFCYTIHNEDGSFLWLFEEIYAFYDYLVDSNTEKEALTATLARHVVHVCKFFEYLVVTHFAKNQVFLAGQIKELKSEFIRLSSSHKSNASALFKSLSDDNQLMIESIIRPSTNSKPNSNNPFSNQSLQMRNYLLIRLMMNYGLRVGELLLLKVGDFKETAQGCLMFVGQLTNKDPRARKPSVKNTNAIRPIMLSASDYKNIHIYIQYFRAKNTSSEFLFLTTGQEPKPLSYLAVHKICSNINEKLQEIYPNPEVVFKPHIARHTWAYNALREFYHQHKGTGMGELSIHQEAMQSAIQQLRVLGGWSEKSQMPVHYGKRFVSEIANEANIKRLQTESVEIELQIPE